MMLSGAEANERVEAVLERNGTEAIRDTARRLGLAPSTLHAFMRRQGYEVRQVTFWQRRPEVSVDSREDDPVPRWMMEPRSEISGR